MKLFSEACERNQEPILAVLREVFADRRRVLEIGSGTGQHAVYFGSHLPHLVWQTSDLADYHESIRAWLAEAALPNVLPPLEIDVNADRWPLETVDAVFCSNAVHIMSWQSVIHLFDGVDRVLASDGVLCLYGPFNYGGRFTSESNAHFDASLKANDSSSGVRDFEAVDELAIGKGLRLWQDVAMPSNNRMLIWRKGGQGHPRAMARQEKNLRHND